MSQRQSALSCHRRRVRTPLALAEKAGLTSGIRRDRGVGVGTPTLPPELYGPTPGSSKASRRPPPPEALLPGRLSAWRAVHREVLVRQQPAGARLRQHAFDEDLGDVAGQRAVPAFGEHDRIPDAVIHLKAHETSERDGCLSVPASPTAHSRRCRAFAAAAPAQLLLGDRGLARLGVERLERLDHGHRSGQSPADDLTGRAERMIVRHSDPSDLGGLDRSWPISAACCDKDQARRAYDRNESASFASASSLALAAIVRCRLSSD
jgi:hypothetical protein